MPVSVWTQDDLERHASRMRKVAAAGEFTGYERELNSPYFTSCKRAVYGTSLIFTRDSGHHTSGWMKNPLYERCLHLSMAPAPRQIWTPETPDLDRKLRNGWLTAFFHADLRYVWAESPKTPQGRQIGVWHWRLFCNEAWEPILPVGEVYSTDFTEKGWKTASEVGAEIISVLDPT